MKFLFHILFALLPAVLWAQSPLFRLQKNETWGELNAKVMRQSSKGWMWIGSQRGVFRCDGLDCDYFALPDSIEGNPHVTALMDQGDSLWVGFSNGIIALWVNSAYHTNPITKSGHDLHPQKGILQLWEPQEGVPTVPITGFATDPQGFVWFSTYGEGLYVWTGKYLYQFNVEDDHLCSDEIYAMLCDKKGRIWAATDNGISLATFSRQEQKMVRNIGLKAGLPDEIIAVLHQDQQGNVWMGTNDKGICKFDLNTEQITPLYHDWPYGEVRDFVVYDNHEVWVSTSEKGLFRCPFNGLLEPMTAPIKIDRMLRDREGQLWILGDNGQLYTANLSTIQFEAPVKNIQALCATNDGKVWAGNPQGLYRLDQNGWHPTGNGNYNVIALAATPEGEVWAGSFGDGICIYRPDGTLKTRIAPGKGLKNGSILSMACVKETVWASTLGGIVVIDRQTLQVRDFGQISGDTTTAKYYVYQLLQDRQGHVWMATDGHGLCKWDGTKVTQWQTVNNQQFRTIYALLEDHNGTIWFSGEQTGLWRYDGQRFQQFTTDHHLHSNQIQSLSMTGQGILVLAYADGVDLLTPQSMHVQFLGKNAGGALSDAGLNAACTDTYGQVWIGSTNGVSRVSAFAQTFQIDPAVLLKSVSNVSKPVDFSQARVFAYDENHLVFEYAGIWLTNPAAVYYRYKLEGFDPDWTVSKDRVASYPNLPPGKYKFRVQASEHGSFEGAQEATYAFEIARPFWTQWWFFVLAFAAAGGAIQWYIVKREARLRKVQEMENEKIAAQLDVLKTQISPHFLFNSFNTLITIIEENPKVAVDYVQHLADFYRSIMVYREKNYIPLAEELDIVHNFGFLLQRRYETALQLEVNIPEPAGQIMPLTLQLLLENAVKHNVISKSQPLRIDIYLENEDTIVVKNNKNLKIKPEPGTRFGLQSLSQRYKMLTGKQVQVVQENGSFLVKIPLIFA